MADLESDIIKATVRGFSRVLILWLISQKPMSGYSVKKELKRLTGQNFHSGVVYPLLYDLEEKELITGQWMQKGRKRIKYYSITEEGTKLLDFLRKISEMPIKEILEGFIS